jgi:N-formylglutamate deformylase
MAGDEGRIHIVRHRSYFSKNCLSRRRSQFTMKYPFMISVPHGGQEIPEEVMNRIALTPEELAFYCDPATSEIYDFESRVAAYIDTPVSRMVVDLNRPPYHIAPKYPDGVIKSVTGFGNPVYREGQFPDINLIHRLMVKYFFPYHEMTDSLTDKTRARIAFDCHSMLPEGLPRQKDSGSARPLICLGNNGDLNGAPRPGVLPTCPQELIQALASHFRNEFGKEGDISLNNPFTGGFISISHHWHREIPWIQIEMNRGMYEYENQGPDQPGFINRSLAHELGERIWDVLAGFWDEVG